MIVYIDSAPEHFTSELALRTEFLLEGRWNGWVRPVATAASMQSFLSEWYQNDPNGTWGTASEVDGALLYTRADDEDDSDVFPLAGVAADGQLLYDLSGWLWVRQ